MEISTIVIDNGTYSTRAGFGGDSEPQCIIPTVVGKQKNTNGSAAIAKDFFVGSEVFQQSSTLNLKCPITDRIITQPEEMEALWSYIFNEELKVNTQEHPVLMTESPQNSKAMREKTTQIMMETFKIPAFYSTYPGVLALYSTGNTNGCVIDAGETITHILPVFECFAMTHIVGRLDIGGRSLNAYLKKLLTERDITLPAANEREIVRDIKEQLCYVALDLKAEMHKNSHSTSADKNFTLPDGTEIAVGSQRYFCPELFFQPQLWNVTASGLAQITADVIAKADEDIRPLLYGNILLSGGSSMFPGLGERMEHDVAAIAPPEARVAVKAPANRKNAAWIGGSVLVSLATYSQMWVTKAEYDETGPSIVHLKCF